MKTANVKLRLKGRVSSRGEADQLIKAPGDAVLVERGNPRWLILGCPCGCGEKFPINLDARVGPAWNLYRRSPNNLTIYPSVWRDSGCKSHYVIWRGNIFLFGGYEDELDAAIADDEIGTLSTQILSALSSHQMLPFATIAEACQADPWDVLTVCRRLVGRGLAREGRGRQAGWFCKTRVLDHLT